jgi:hypothetical protein
VNCKSLSTRLALQPLRNYSASYARLAFVILYDDNSAAMGTDFGRDVHRIRFAGLVVFQFLFHIPLFLIVGPSGLTFLARLAEMLPITRSKSPFDLIV